MGIVLQNGGAEVCFKECFLILRRLKYNEACDGPLLCSYNNTIIQDGDQELERG